MNLFILDRSPTIAVQYYADAHVRKIILEAVEMMGYAYDHGRFQPLPWLHSQGTHEYHPMSKWVRRSRQNFDWTLQHAYALCGEYTYRSSHGRPHAYIKHLDWISLNLPLQNLSNSGMTDWPRCFGDWRETVGVTEDAVHDYRRYYCLAKRHLATWTKRPIPDWYK